MNALFFHKVHGAIVLLALFFGTVDVSPGQPNHTKEKLTSRGVADDKTYEIDVAGLKRAYHVHAPVSSQTNRSLPVVLAFHGGTGLGSRMNRLTGLNDVADREGFIVIYPEGVDRHWNDGRSTVPNAVDDVAFVSALLEDLAKKYNINRKCIYATGISNGGFFSMRLACELSDKIAAVASVAATMPEGFSCHPSHPISVMFIHGTEDPFVPYAGGQVKGKGTTWGGYGGRALSVADAVKFWVTHDGCASAAKRSEVAARANDGTSVTREEYEGGKARSKVIVYTIKGGGHAWPGGLQYAPQSMIGKASDAIKASEVIWKFFRQHSLN